MRLIDAEKLMQMISTEEYNARMVIANAPTVDAEPTEEQIKDYCRKRGLVVVSGELFNEMKARWSATQKSVDNALEALDEVIDE